MNEKEALLPTKRNWPCKPWLRLWRQAM